MASTWPVRTIFRQKLDATQLARIEPSAWAVPMAPTRARLFSDAHEPLPNDVVAVARTTVFRPMANVIAGQLPVRLSMSPAMANSAPVGGGPGVLLGGPTTVSGGGAPGGGGVPWMTLPSSPDPNPQAEDNAAASACVNCSADARLLFADGAVGLRPPRLGASSHAAMNAATTIVVAKCRFVNIGFSSTARSSRTQGSPSQPSVFGCAGAGILMTGCSMRPVKFRFLDRDRVPWALSGRTVGRARRRWSAQGARRVMTTATVLLVMSKNSTEYPSSAMPGDPGQNGNGTVPVTGTDHR